MVERWLPHPTARSGGALLSAAAVNYFVLLSADVNYGSFEACEAALLDFQSLAFLNSWL